MPIGGGCSSGGVGVLRNASCDNGLRVSLVIQGTGIHISHSLGDRMRHRAFTLVELLVVIAIIGILVSLLLPAVQQAREAARRMACHNNLKQLGLAIHNYHDTNGCMPSSTTSYLSATTRFCGSNVALLPFLEQGPLYQQYDMNIAWNSGSNVDILTQMPGLFVCPSAVDGGMPNEFTGYQTSDYTYPTEAYNLTARSRLGHGAFISGVFYKFKNVTDGLSNTIAMHESVSRAHLYLNRDQIRPLPTWAASWGGVYEAWSSSKSSSAYPVIPIQFNSSVSPPTYAGWLGGIYNNANFYAFPYTFHSASNQMLLLDGSVRGWPESGDSQLFNNMVSINSGEVLGEF